MRHCVGLRSLNVRVLSGEQDPERCSAAFADLLLGYLADGRVAPIARSAAAAYLASFLARAAFVPDGVLIASLARLARWCQGYCAEQVRSKPCSERRFVPGLLAT